MATATPTPLANKAPTSTVTDLHDAVVEALREVQERQMSTDGCSPKDIAVTANSLFLLEHPECCSTLADYPEFAARFAITEDDAR